MISSLDANAKQFLNNVAKIQARLETAVRQVSSGKRITTASDDPDQISTLLQLRADLARNTQITANLGRAQTEVDVAENALESAVSLIESAQTLAADGADTTTTAEKRATLAGEVDAILQRMVALSQTVVEGRYIFSGDESSSAQYQLDSTSSTGVERLFTTTTTRLASDASGTTFTIAQTAQDIFDARNEDDTVATGNVFAALNALKTALENDDDDAIMEAIGTLDDAATHMNNQLARYGFMQNRLASAVSEAASRDTALQAQISTIEDADLTAAATELTQSTTALQAAMLARAKMPTKSLFDYLA